MIDLTKQSDQIQHWMDNHIQRFLTESVPQLPTSVGLYSSPPQGWISLCLDISKSPDRLNTNCLNFTHREYAQLDFPEWKNEYESESRMIKRHDSKVVRGEAVAGDAKFNQHFFDFLMRVVNDYYHSDRIVFRPVWIGVQIVKGRSSFGRVYQPN